MVPLPLPPFEPDHHPHPHSLTRSNLLALPSPLPSNLHPWSSSAIQPPFLSISTPLIQPPRSPTGHPNGLAQTPIPTCSLLRAQAASRANMLLTTTLMLTPASPLTPMRIPTTRPQLNSRPWSPICPPYPTRQTRMAHPSIRISQASSRRRWLLRPMSWAPSIALPTTAITRQP